MKKMLFLLLFINLFLSGEVVHWPYGQEYKNYALTTHQPIGVVVTAFNRPEYFKKTLVSLEQTPEANSLPFFFIIDGGLRATQQELAAIVGNSTIQKKNLILLDQNYGNGRNVLDARRFMFEWCNFDKILVFEDDIVITPEYITLTLRLHEWATKNYDNIGAVCCYNDCFLGNQDKEKRLLDVEETIDKYWGYCMDKATYNDIKDLLDEFEQRYLTDMPAYQPNCELIGDWMAYHMKANKRPNATKRSFRSIIDYNAYFKNYISKLYERRDQRRDGQDMETRFAFFMKGKIKISTTVNRAVYIGVDGTHHHDLMWQKNNLEYITLTRFRQDAYTASFKTVYDKLNRLKILFVVSELPHATHTPLAYQIQHLMERGHVPYFLIHKQKIPHRSITNGLYSSLDFYDLKGRIFNGSVPKKHREFDIIMSEFGEDSAVCIDLKKSGVEGQLVTLFSNNNTESFLKKYSNLGRDLMVWGDCFMAISLYGKQKLIKCGFDARRAITCYQGTFRKQSSVLSRIPEKFSPIRIVIIADLLPDKGLEYALYALAKLVSQFRGLSLTIIGSGPLYADLKDLVSSLSLLRNVEFIKSASHREMYDILNRSHIMLCPSTNVRANDEDMNLSMLTAMGLALPIIVTRDCGISELIEDGVTGFLITERSSDSIVKVVQFLLKNPKKIDEIGRAGMRKMSSFLNVRKLCYDMEKTLRMICSGDNRKRQKACAQQKK